MTRWDTDVQSDYNGTSMEPMKTGNVFAETPKNEQSSAVRIPIVLFSLSFFVGLVLLVRYFLINYKLDYRPLHLNVFSTCTKE